MNIIKISIKNLFGQYNHEVNMRIEEGITIIYGLNGVGKTTLLKLTKEALSSEVTDLVKTPFDKLEITFDNGNIMEISKIPQIADKIDANQLSLDFNEIQNEEFSNDVEEPKKIYYYLKNREGETIEQYSRQLKPHRRLRPIEIDEKLPFLRRIVRGVWRDISDGQIYSLDDIEENFGHLIDPPNLPSWIESIHKSFHIHYIGANRLHGVGRLFEEYYDTPKGILTPAVLLNSRELTKEIETNLATFARVSQELDRTFPNRLINRMITFKEELIPIEKEIIERLEYLEEKRTSLAKVSLLDSAKDTAMNVPIGVSLEAVMDTHTRNVLDLYIEDTEEKLRELDGMEARLNLFVNIVNKRLSSTKKSISVDREKGYRVTLSNGEEIALEKLSSGEQHEIVLLYDLLFKTTKGSFVLVDEPELSLHITWQQKFLEDVIDIAKLTGLKMLIATHSPDIISTRWDLTESLEEDL